MFKKILFGIFAFILGFMIYYFCQQTYSNDAYIKRIKESSQTEDFEFILRFFDYHKKEAIFEDENENLKIKAFAVYSEKLSFAPDYIVKESVEYKDVKGITFIIYSINKDVALEPNDEEASNQFSITLNANGKTFKYPSDVKDVDGNVANIPIKDYIDSFSLYTLTLYGPSIDRYLGSVLPDGSINESVSTIDHITITDANGNNIFDKETTNYLSYSNIDPVDMKKNGIITYSDAEIKQINFPSEVIWNLVFVMFVYCAVVTGIAFALFYRKK